MADNSFLALGLSVTSLIVNSPEHERTLLDQCKTVIFSSFIPLVVRNFILPWVITFYFFYSILQMFHCCVPYLRKCHLLFHAAKYSVCIDTNTCLTSAVAGLHSHAFSFVESPICCPEIFMQGAKLNQNSLKQFC